MDCRVLPENISKGPLGSLEEQHTVYAARHTFHQQVSLYQTPLKISYLIRRLTPSICSSPG